MLRTLRVEINVKQQNFPNKAIGIIIFDSIGFFSKFYRRHYQLFLIECRYKRFFIKDPEFYGDLVYNLP